MTQEPTTPDRLREALQQPSPSARLQAALAAGSRPDPSCIEVLIARCAVEPDFGVRDTLTWALTRHDADLTVPRLLAAATGAVPQARAQALHTLSKIADPRGWDAITPEVLRDTDDEIARAAWRAAVVLVPAGGEPDLARSLCGQLGRGPIEVSRSLSRAIAALGEAGAVALAEVLEPADADEPGDPDVRAHAIATAVLLADPDAGFDAAVADARREVALRSAPTVPNRPEPPHEDR